MGAPVDALEARYAAIEQRLHELERALKILLDDATPVTDTSLDVDDEELLRMNTINASPTQLRLHAELTTRGVRHRFVHAPHNYYSRNLLYRKYETAHTIIPPTSTVYRDVLGAASVFHLCKSIVFENTKAPPDVVDCSNPRNSKYYLVITQYAYKLDTTKLDIFLHKLNGGSIARRCFKLRVAPEEVGCSLTGFGHNAVSPVGMATQLPIIVASTIPALKPDVFWMGGGEVHVKLGMRASDFIGAYGAMVADIVDTATQAVFATDNDA